MTGFFVDETVNIDEYVENVYSDNKYEVETFTSRFRVKAKQSQSLANNYWDNLLGSDFLKTLTSGISQYVNRDLKRVRIDPSVGETKIKQKADSCQNSNSSLFLKLPRADELPQKQKSFTWLVKRAFDWLAALTILIVISPVMMALAATIAFTSSGPILFSQWRVGEGGKMFKIIKFRSMVTNADQLHAQVMAGQTGLHKCEDDPRVTAVGRWMRKYSLDELPQLFNVLRGEMSLVGPRPWALYDALRISGNAKRRLNSLPGVTGAWQVSARSTMLDIDAVTECDLSYLRTWSLWSDLKILLMTVPKVLSGFGAC
ncbi:MAG: UDP-phosphate galactose phosphotransferase [Oscillatoriales cyanobacterium CG2_30_44_21]|nr:MAG: UDP-phosphate galactose phosphotransferase [Oscillatoriales cyanobacterium CG2_30_44_21]